MADEATLLAKWVSATLAADSTITNAVSTRIHQGVNSNQIQTFPYIVYTVIPLDDDRTIGTRMWANFLLDVKIINQGNSFATYSAVASQIDELFRDKKEVAITGGVIKNCDRKSLIRYDEMPSTGVRNTHQGCSFLVAVQAS